VLKEMLQLHTLTGDEDTLFELTGKIDNVVKKEDGDGKIQLPIDENGRFRNHNILQLDVNPKSRPQ